jgi:hypothetical protein
MNAGGSVKGRNEHDDTMVERTSVKRYLSTELVGEE